MPSVKPPAILDRLRGVQPTGSGWLAFCPAHEDREKRSLSVGVGEDGKTLLNCFARRCSAEAIARAVNMSLEDLGGANDPTSRPQRREVATYDYRDERGELLYQVVRFEPKDFRQRRPDGHGGWTWSVKGVRRVVYRLDELAEAERIYQSEGEKDVDRLVALGLRATTTAGGAAGWHDEYADQVKAAGVVEVVILPDADTPGERYAVEAARSYLRRMLRVKIVRLPDLPEHGDVSDWLDAGHPHDELMAIVDAAPWLEEPPELAPESTAGPRVTLEGEDGAFTWADAEIRMAGTRESSEGIQAECSVTLRGIDVHWARLNLASTAARQTLERKLTAIDGEIPWRDRLELACRRMADHVRQGSPLVPLCPAPRPAGQQDLIAGVLPIDATSVLYGDGDTGKGWVALLCALAVVTGKELPHLRPTRRGVRVAVLDWESTEADLAARLYQLCRGLGLTLPPGMILYRPMARALADETPRLRVDFARHGAEFVIVDSLGPACGAEPEGADSAIRAMNALRTLTGTTRLVLAHVSKMAADQPQGATRPYGSVFVRNLARSAWELRRAEDTDPDELTVAAYHRKSNSARRSQPFGLALRFTENDDTVTVHGSNLNDAPDLLARTPLSQQIRAALANGAKTIPGLAIELDVPEATVGRTVRRMRERGEVVQVGEAKPPYLWGLVAR